MEATFEMSVQLTKAHQIANILHTHESWVEYDEKTQLYKVPIFNGIASTEFRDLLSCGFAIYNIMVYPNIDESSPKRIQIAIMEAGQ